MYVHAFGIEYKAIADPKIGSQIQISRTQNPLPVVVKSKVKFGMDKVKIPGCGSLIGSGRIIFFQNRASLPLMVSVSRISVSITSSMGTTSGFCVLQANKKMKANGTGCGFCSMWSFLSVAKMQNHSISCTIRCGSGYLSW